MVPAGWRWDPNAWAPNQNQDPPTNFTGIPTGAGWLGGYVDPDGDVHHVPQDSAPWTDSPKYNGKKPTVFYAAGKAATNWQDQRYLWIAAEGRYRPSGGRQKQFVSIGYTIGGSPNAWSRTAAAELFPEQYAHTDEQWDAAVQQAEQSNAAALAERQRAATAVQAPPPAPAIEVGMIVTKPAVGTLPPVIAPQPVPVAAVSAPKAPVAVPGPVATTAAAQPINHAHNEPWAEKIKAFFRKPDGKPDMLRVGGALVLVYLGARAL